MTNPIEDLKAVDLMPYREARALTFKAQQSSRAADTALREASKTAVASLRKRATKLIGPHVIVWQDYDNLSINHTDWTVSAHLSGDIIPTDTRPYARQARASIRFSLTGASLEEFDEVCHGLKAAADALAEMLYGKKS